MASPIGALTVVIGADISALKKALKDSAKALSDHDASIRDHVNTLGKLAAGAAAAGAAVVTALVARSFDAIDAQSKLARQLNATISGMETLRRAADLAGVDQEKLTLATRKLQVAIGEALQGSKEQKEAFDRLGLSAAELSKMDVDQRVLAVNEALRQNVPAAERAAVAGQLFGDRMGLAISQLGADEIKTARQEVEALGLAVSEVDARTIERANDALSTINEVIRGIGNRLAVAIAPAVEALATWFRNTAIETRGWEKQLVKAVEIAVKAVAFLLDMWHGLKTVVQVTADVAIIAWAKVARQVEMMFGSWKDRLMAMAPLLGPLGVAIRNAWMAANSGASQYDGIIKEATAHIKELLEAPLPGQKVEDFFKKLREQSEAASRGFDEPGSISVVGGMSEEERKKLDEKLEALRESLRTEEQAENVSHQKRLKDLQELNDLKLLSDKEYNQLRELEFQRHEKVIDEIQKKKNEDAVREKERPGRTSRSAARLPALGRRSAVGVLRDETQAARGRQDAGDPE
jgi:hypothetical protein